MENILLNIIKAFSTLNEIVLSPIHELLENLGIEHWLNHAIIDCVQMIPFLFVVFLCIELIEHFYFNKIIRMVQITHKAGPIIGSLFASLPQCGFSVIASTLYTKKYITKATLIAVFIATSDEAIPILLSSPSSIKYVVPLLLTKVAIAIIAGYIIYLFERKSITENIIPNKMIETEQGCHHHHITNKKHFEIIIHPIKHTINVFIFILLVTIGINYLIHISGGPEQMSKYFLNNTLLQPVIASIIGLIPSCAVSVGITLLFINGAISYGSTIAGLCSGAGLGLLILFNKNSSIKDTIKIILLLVFISMTAGILIQTFYK